MNEGGLFEAWRSWLSGDQVQNSLLWGLKILWWARIGKVIQLLAALTIIADIIGPARLRSFGNSMHGTFTLKKADYYVRDALQWLPSILRYAHTNDPLKGQKELEVMQKFKSDKINYFVCLFVTAMGVYLISFRVPWWAALVGAIGGYTLFLLTLSPIATVILLLIFSVGGLLIDSLLIEPLAWMIERPDFEKWVKIGSILLLLIGFHFDLLGS